MIAVLYIRVAWVKQCNACMFPEGIGRTGTLAVLETALFPAVKEPSNTSAKEHMS